MCLEFEDCPFVPSQRWWRQTKQRAVLHLLLLLLLLLVLWRLALLHLLTLLLLLKWGHLEACRGWYLLTVHENISALASLSRRHARCHPKCIERGRVGHSSTPLWRAACLLRPCANFAIH